MHPELLAMWCLPCYSGEKYPKVPYSQPPAPCTLFSIQGTGSSPGEGVKASLPHPQPPSQYRQGGTGRVQGP